MVKFLDRCARGLSRTVDVMGRRATAQAYARMYYAGYSEDVIRRTLGLPND
jgi:hypothetical protein